MSTDDHHVLHYDLRRLAPADAAAYRALRLESLLRHPESFGSSWEDEADQPLDWFAERLDRNVVFGALRDTSIMGGTAGLFIPQALKSRHKGIVWGMYVRPEDRGAGMAAALLAGVLAHAATTISEVRLTVSASNTAAIGLYRRVGFKPYGLEPRALKVGERFHDELLMALTLHPADVSSGPDRGIELRAVAGSDATKHAKGSAS